jgi:peroxiredoxin
MTDLQQSIGDGEHSYNIMAISRGGTQQEIEAFRNEYELRFPIAADEDKSIYSMYATMYVPRCYVVDQQGIVRFVTFEYEAGDVDRLLAELSKFIK